MKVYKKTLLIIILICLLFLEFVFSDIIQILKYIDEFYAIIAFWGICCWFCKKGNKRISSENKKIIIFLFIACMIGFLGNIKYKLCPNSFSTIIDFIGVIKALVVFVFTYSYLSDVSAKQVSAFFYRWAKIYLWVITFFGIASCVVDLGMGGEVRFGHAAYTFIFGHAHLVAITVMCSLLIISSRESSKSRIYLYTILTCICQVLTTKGPSIIWVVMIFIMFRYYLYNKKIKPWLIILLVIISILSGGYQITNYFMNSTAPRALFLKYGFITANTYFPFGSGFATFGSAQAAVNYSSLYYRYGFNNIWGMSLTDGYFLNDTYWPMLIAQLGYIGTALMIGCYYLFFRGLQKQCENRMVRAILMTNFIYIMLHSLGSALLTGMEGVFLFAVYGAVLAIYKQK